MSDKLQEVLCDIYDIQNMARLDGFGKLPKDNEGTEFTIDDCIDNVLSYLEQIEKREGVDYE